MREKSWKDFQKLKITMGTSYKASYITQKNLEYLEDECLNAQTDLTVKCKEALMRSKAIADDEWGGWNDDIAIGVLQLSESKVCKILNLCLKWGELKKTRNV